MDIFGIHLLGIVAQSKNAAELLEELHRACGSIGMLLILGHGIPDLAIRAPIHNDF